MSATDMHAAGCWWDHRVERRVCVAGCRAAFAQERSWPVALLPENGEQLAGSQRPERVSAKRRY